MKGYAGEASPCHTCAHRTWRSVHGFMLMGCGVQGLRFGIGPDLARGHVNKAGGCVALPKACRMANRTAAT